MFKDKQAFISGLIHAGKVLVWVSGSAVVSFLVANGLDPFIPHFSQNWPYLVPIVNSITSGWKRWYDTHQEP